MTQPIRIDGASLDLGALVRVARGGASAEVADWSALEASRAWVDDHVAAWRNGTAPNPVYGVTTGFGSSRNVRLSAGEIEDAQANLVRSHAFGAAIGGDDFFDEEVVRAAALLRANTFLSGRSGVRRVLVEHLLRLLDAGVHPRVPQRGSVGASGDLCPLAHFALVLIGEGEATTGREGARRIVPGEEALREAGLEPLALQAKEGLALINGTTFSSACLALAVHDADVLARTADVACALAFEALGAHGRALDPKVHAARGQAGQQDSAASLRALLARSTRASTTDDRQDNYSLRCAPQVHGAARDALSHARGVALSELNGVTDNPLLFALEGDSIAWDLDVHGTNAARFGREPDAGLAYSAGNFHGQPVGLAADLVAIAVTQLASISERRIALMVNPAFSRGLPAHLSPHPGVKSGLMLAQYTAAALVSECKGLAHPASVDSIPTGNGAEDHVPMSTWAGRKARTAVALARQVIALELLVAAQANDWRALRPDPAVETGAPTAEEEARFAAMEAAEASAGLDPSLASVLRLVRSLSPRLTEDRSLAPDAAAVAGAVRDGAVLAASRGGVVPLRLSVLLPG